MCAPSCSYFSREDPEVTEAPGLTPRVEEAPGQAPTAALGRWPGARMLSPPVLELLPPDPEQPERKAGTMGSRSGRSWVPQPGWVRLAAREPVGKRSLRRRLTRLTTNIV